jgi:hypothetical protein
MSDIEKRLEALEKRGRVDDERWQIIDAQTKAFSLILHAIGAPICATQPKILPLIIKNLRTFENSARLTNEHAKVIEEFRFAREFFESRQKLPALDDSTSAKKAAPPGKK